MTSPIRGLLPIPRSLDIRSGRAFDDLLAQMRRPALPRPSPTDDRAGQAFDDLLAEFRDPPPRLPAVTVSTDPTQPAPPPPRLPGVTVMPPMGRLPTVEVTADPAPWSGKPNELTLPPDESEFGRALRQALTGTGLAHAGRGLRAAGEAITSPALFGIRQALTGMGESAIETGTERAATIAAPRVPSHQNVRSFGDAVDYIAQAVGQGVGSSIPSIGAALATGGSSVPLQVGAALIPSLAQNYGATEEEFEQLAPNMDPAERRRKALATGLPVALVDAVADRFLGGLLSDVAGAPLRTAGRRVASGAASEALTESAQEGMQYIGTRLGTDTPMAPGEAASRLLDAFLQGGLAGGGMTAGPTAVAAAPEVANRVGQKLWLTQATRNFDELLSAVRRADEHLNATAPDWGVREEEAVKPPRVVQGRKQKADAPEAPAEVTRVANPLPQERPAVETMTREELERELTDTLKRPPSSIPTEAEAARAARGADVSDELDRRTAEEPPADANRALVDRFERPGQGPIELWREHGATTPDLWTIRTPGENGQEGISYIQHEDDARDKFAELTNRLPKAPPINPDSRYAKEGESRDPDWLRHGLKSQARSSLRQWQEAEQKLQDGTRRGPKKQQQLEAFRDRTRKEYEDFLGRLRDAFGPAEADRVDAEIRQRLTAAPKPAPAPEPVPAPPAAPEPEPEPPDEWEGMPAVINTRNGPLTRIGRNARGEQLYADERGVRFLRREGQGGLSPESVPITPAGPDLAALADRRKDEYQVQETAPAPESAPEAVSQPLPAAAAPENNAVTSPEPQRLPITSIESRGAAAARYAKGERVSYKGRLYYVEGREDDWLKISTRGEDSGFDSRVVDPRHLDAPPVAEPAATPSEPAVPSAAPEGATSARRTRPATFAETQAIYRDRVAPLFQRAGDLPYGSWDQQHELYDEARDYLEQMADHLGLPSRQRPTPEADAPVDDVVAQVLRHVIGRTRITQHLMEHGDITREQFADLVRGEWPIMQGGQGYEARNPKNPVLVLEPSGSGQPVKVSGKKLMDAAWQAMKMDDVLARIRAEGTSDAAVQPDGAVSPDGSTGGVRESVAGQPLPQRPGDVQPPDAGGAPAVDGPGRGDGSGLDAVDAQDAVGDRAGEVPRPADQRGSRARPDREAVPGDRDGGPAESRTPDAAPDERGASDATRAVADRIEDNADAVRAASPGATNFRYTPELLARLEQGSTVEKVKRNLAAIRLSNQIEAEERHATAEEQETLALFAGWGPVRDAFDERDYSRNAMERRRQLREELGEEDYQAARRATLDSHYTSPKVVQAMWRMVQRLGFAGGVALEPSIGAGFFVGMRPTGIAARWMGVELDPTTARIARLLYPEASIVQSGLQEVDIPDGSVDLVIGNPPFGSIKVVEAPRTRVPRHLTRQIHNYMFARALQAVRPGGLVAFITSDGTMDATASAPQRRWMMEQADLVAAFRLPSDAFGAIANTQVTTDLIILQKRAPGQPSDAESWADVTGYDQASDGVRYRVNEYYARHPDHMLGELTYGGMYGETDQRLLSTGDLEAALRTMEDRLPSGIVPARPTAAPTRAPRLLSGEERRRVNTYQVQGNEIVTVEADGSLTPVKVPATAVPRVRRYIALRDARRAAVQAQLDPTASDAQVAEAIKALHAAYQAFVDAHGPLSLEKRSTRTVKKKDGTVEEQVATTYPNLKDLDSEAPVVATLDSVDYDLWEAGDKQAAVQRAAMLSQRVVWPEGTMATRAQPTTDEEAYAQVLGATGRVDLAAMAALRNTTAEDMERRLERLVYRDPTDGTPVTAEQYLSGDVKTKLAVAVSAARLDPAFQRNVDALRAIQPPDVSLADVSIRLGQTWIPEQVYGDFLRETFYPAFRHLTVGVTRSVSGEWLLEWPNARESEAANLEKYGTSRMPGLDIADAVMNNAPIVVRDPKDAGGGINTDETEKARDRALALEAAFVEWVLGETERTTALQATYNEVSNRHVTARWDGDHLTTPGIARTLGDGKPFAWHSHQKNAIWRFITHGSVLLQHPVGSGKTFEMAAMAMEARRLGLARKPLVTYPNALQGQWPKEFAELYPGAKLLVATGDDMDGPEARQAFWTQAQTGDYDAILAPHSMFERIQVGEAKRKEWIREEIAQLDAIMEELEEAAGGRGGRKRRSASVRDLEKRRAALEAKLEAGLAQEKKRYDNFVTFEELGIDLLIVDEAHEYKNAPVASANPQIKTTTPSDRAVDMALKLRMVRQVNPTHGIILASGTTVANNVAPELYHFMRLIDPTALTDRGIRSFDGFIREFASMSPKMEQKGDGSFQYVPRVDEWTNLPELQSLMRNRWDVLLVDPDLTRQAPPRGMIRLPRPPVRGGKPIVVTTPEPPGLAGFMQNLAALYKDVLARMKARESMEGWPAIPNIASLGEAAAIDMRLVDPDAQDSPASKLSVAAQKIMEEYHESAPHRGVQLVLLNLQERDPKSERLPRGVPGFNTHRELVRKLVEAGVPRSEIAIFNDQMSLAQRAKAIRDARAGRVRVLIGSTKRMGVGLNVQTRAVAIHHIDTEWRPADIEQRNGRVYRQGNLLFAEGLITGVVEYRYVTPMSYDAFKWSKVARKQESITALLRDTGARTTAGEDYDESMAAMTQVQAIASGNPYLLDMAEARQKIAAAERAVARARSEKISRASRAGMARTTLRAAENVERLATRDAALVPVDLNAAMVEVEGESHPLGSKEAREAMTRKMLTTARSLTERRRTGVGEGDPVWRTAGFQFELVRWGTHYSLWMTNASAPAVEAEQISYESVKWQSEDTAQVDPVMRTRNLLAKPAQRVEGAKVETARLAADLAELTQDTGVGTAQVDLDNARARLKDLERQLNEYQASRRPSGSEPPGGGVDGEVELGAYFDPVTPAVRAGWQAIQRRLAMGQARAGSLYRPLDPTVAARWDVGRAGIRPDSLKESWEQTLEKAKRLLRSIPAIAPDASPVHAVVNDLLLNQYAVREWARQMAYTRVQSVVAGLNEAEEELLTWALRIVDDLRGIEGGAASSLGFRTEDEARTAERDIMAEVRKHEKVQAALERRQRMALEVTTELVEAGLLDPRVLEDTRYYHRQILDFYNLRHRQAGGQSSALRPRKYGFMKRRTWSDRIANNQYREAEFEWLAQAFARLQTDRTVEGIRSLVDQKPALMAQAKAANRHAVLEATGAPHGLSAADVEADPNLNPYRPFAQRIARSTGELYDLAMSGALQVPSFDAFFLALQRQVAGATTKAKRQKALASFRHPDWYRLLAVLAQGDPMAPGALQARVILKALADRRQMEKDVLGDAHLTWEDMVPDGYVIHQLEPGHLWVRGMGTTENLLDGAQVVPVEELRDVWIRGAPKPQWVIPEWAAEAIDRFTVPRPDESEAPFLAATRAWKWLKLQAPWRLPKYMLNNTVGDLDAAIVAPDVLRHVRASARDLFTYMQAPQDLAPAVQKELEEWTRLRVIGSGLSVAEITELRDEMTQAASLHPLDWMGWITRYPQQARQITQWRENILRLAAARAFERARQEGKPRRYLASNPKKVDALRDREQDAQLARDLIGDYGNVSHGGQWLRSRAIPFYSWMEINARRYYWLFRNAGRDAGALGRATASSALGVGAVTAGAFAGKVALVNLFTALVSLWNHLRFPDEAEKLRDEERGLYLITHRTEDGDVGRIRTEGAWADFLSWLDLNDARKDLLDLSDGRTSWAELGQEMAQAPINKLMQSLHPAFKTPLEALTGRSLFPNAFESRPLRDRTKPMFEAVELGWLYDRVTRKPQRDRTIAGTLGNLIAYQTNPNEAAYYYIRERVRAFEEATNTASARVDPTDRSNALYYFRKATAWGDEASARHWLREYLREGGTMDGLKKSLRPTDPLAGLNARQKRAFLSALTPHEAKSYAAALAHVNTSRQTSTKP